MARVFVTGSADGLGQLAARLLLDQGHSVVLHARNEQRAKDAQGSVPGAEGVVIGDISTLGEMRKVAEQVNGLGDFDAVIHNAAMGYREPGKGVTADGFAQVFAVNSLAPYVLTALIRRPKRLIYMSSGLHREGDDSLRDLAWVKEPWNGYKAYSDSKFHDVLLALAVARKWKDVYSNAVDPGWVPTKMGGRGAPGNLVQGAETQAWLAVSDEPGATVSGKYFYHKMPGQPHPAASRVELQHKFLMECARMSGIEL